MGVPKNGRFIMEIPIKMDDLGGTPISGNLHLYVYIYMYAYTYEQNHVLHLHSFWGSMIGRCTVLSPSNAC